MGSPSEITYPEKVASRPSSEKTPGGGGEKGSDDDFRRRRQAAYEKLSLAMATIQDDDERLLTRIGYKQVFISFGGDTHT